MTTNTTKFFKGITNLEQLRSTYKDLIKKNHPDNGGDTETMKEINIEYKKIFEELKKGVKFETADAKQDEKTKQKWSYEADEFIREALNKIIRFDGVNIEIVGCWIWCDGATFNYKEELKSAGFQWSKARKKWHYTPYDTAWHKGKKKSFEEIRKMYGSVEVETETQKAIA